MKRIADFDSVEDLGFNSKSLQKNGTKFINCDESFTESTLGNLSFVKDDTEDGSVGKFETLTTIYSGGSILVYSESEKNLSQSRLPLDYTQSTSLGYFGSVYSHVTSAINNIVDNYPNGFLIVEAHTAAGNTLIFSHDQAYTYGKQFNSGSTYSGFELMSLYLNAEVSTYTILSADVRNTGTTLTLDGTPVSGTDWTYAVYPSTEKTENFYSTVSPYGYNLLVPPYTRTNYWPRDTIATQNLKLEGTTYDTFVETELDWASLADNEDSNFLWRKIYPDGQKYLDSDDNLMQKLIISYASAFDDVKKYQDQLANLHTIGYEQHNHIPMDLVDRLSSLWNITLSKTFIDQYYSLIFNTYDNYVTGTSLQDKVSGEYMEFELWRRILANIVYLYKKKGTKESIMYFLNIFNVPEKLFKVEEIATLNGFNYVDKVVLDDKNSVSFPSTIFVQSGNTFEYVDVDGSVSAFTASSIVNNMELVIDISVMNALEYDFWDWGWENHPDITDINGNTVKISGTNKPQQFLFEADTINKLIRSDGLHRYAQNYPILENEFFVYRSGDPGYVTPSSLRSYVDFLENSWTQTISQLIPSSSKVVSQGEVHRNPWWQRQKYKWQESELDPVALPFNSGMTITHVTPSLTTKSVYSGSPTTGSTIPSEKLSTHEISPLTGSSLPSEKEPIRSLELGTGSSVVSSTVGSYSGYSPTYTPYGEQLDVQDDTWDVSIVKTGTTEYLGSPLFVPISGQYGTTTFVDYSNDATVVTNNSTFDIVFSASNLSESGYTKFNIELFKNTEGSEGYVDTSKEYSITKVMFEQRNRGGVYQVSSMEGLEAGFNIAIVSDYSAYTNNTVKIVQIDTDKNTIRTIPEIGISYSVTNSMYGIIDWMEYIGSNSFEITEYVHSVLGLDSLTIIAMYTEILNAVPNLDDINTINNIVFKYSKAGNNVAAHIVRLNNPALLYASTLLIEYLRSNPSLSINIGEQKLVGHYINEQINFTFFRAIDYFDWKNPDQSIVIDNQSEANMSGWTLPEYTGTGSITSANTYSVTGTVTVGGLDELYADILKDKKEYFLRFKSDTHAPSGWSETYVGIPTISGHNLVEGEYEKVTYNGVPYYGNYFLFMSKPKEAYLSDFPVDGTGTTLETASVTIKWKGVSDSDRLELQFLNNGTDSGATLDSYSSITSGHWLTAITINVPARKNVGDDYIYTQQTTLDVDTYYWWRVKNFRNKVNMFGHNLETFTSTKPYAFKTGSFTEEGQEQGEIGQTATAPVDKVSGTQNIDSDWL